MSRTKTHAKMMSPRNAKLRHAYYWVAPAAKLARCRMRVARLSSRSPTVSALSLKPFANLASKGSLGYGGGSAFGKTLIRWITRDCNCHYATINPCRATKRQGAT